MGKPMDNLKDIICQELDQIAEKNQLSAGDVDTVYKLIVAKEKLLRIEELEGELGYSQEGSMRSERGSYGNGYSGRHYVRGHYSRSGYSMDEAKEDIKERMRQMMEDPEMSQSERSSMKRAMDMMR